MVDSDYNKTVRLRWLRENLLLVLLQCTGLKITTLYVGSHIAWIASGISCGFLFLRGTSILPGIFVGSVLAYLSENLSWLPALAIAALLTLQPWLVLLFCYRFLKPTLIFYRIRESLAFLIFSGGLTGIISWLMLLVCQPFMPPGLVYKQIGLDWWLANWVGLCAFAPLLVLWDAYYPDFREFRDKKTLWIKLAVLTGLSLIILFNPGFLSALTVGVILTSLSWRLGMRN